MKKLTSETKIILFLSFLVIVLVFTFMYTINKEHTFLKSEFSKKVEQICSFRNIDCVYFTDKTSAIFSVYSIIEENDTLFNVRLIDYIDLGDSIIKHKNEVLIRLK